MSKRENDAVQERLEAAVGMYERVFPKLMATLAAIREDNARKVADMGLTYEQWRALPFAAREEVLLAWFRTHRAEVREQRLRVYVALRTEGETTFPVGPRHDRSVSVEEAARRSGLSLKYAERVGEPRVAQALAGAEGAPCGDDQRQE